MLGSRFVIGKCGLASLLIFLLFNDGYAQNIERYKPLDLNQSAPNVPEVPDEKLSAVAGDDRILVETLDAVVIVDNAEKVSKEISIDTLEGLIHNFAAGDSIVFSPGVSKIVDQYLGRPITLRNINQLARDIILYYRECKQPIVDVLIPEQRITGGTLHLVIIESRIDRVRIEKGSYFCCHELSRWIECTTPGDRIHISNLENDLFWLNQNPFRRVTVDFEKGRRDGTTDVIYKVNDIIPLRGYLGADDTGVKTLNYGRFFTGFSYGNAFGRGGTIGYQFTTDQDFDSLAAHAISFHQPLSRQYSINGYGSWASVASNLGNGIQQGGESWQNGASAVRHLIRTPDQSRSLSFGYDFKSTDNNLEFAGTTIVNSNADLFELKFGYEDFVRKDIDQYALIRWDAFVGPGDGFTGNHSTAAFQTIRPGTSTDFFYTKILAERMTVGEAGWQLLSRFRGQVASERLLFSETLGIGGFDTLRGFDQRSYNADHGWVINLELGPEAKRWGEADNAKMLRMYTFTDIGNGYLADPLPGEDAYLFTVSTGAGLRYQLSDRLTCRLDYGYGLRDIFNAERSNRLHFGLTWIPGRRP